MEILACYHWEITLRKNPENYIAIPALHSEEIIVLSIQIFVEIISPIYEYHSKIFNLIWLQPFCFIEVVYFV